MERMNSHQRLQTASFLVLLFGMSILVFFLVRPLFDIVLASVILTILFKPLYNKLAKWLKHDGLSAGLSVAIILLIILLPVWLFGQLLFNEISGLYQTFRQGGFNFDQGALVSSLPVGVQDFLTSFSTDFNSWAGKISTNAFQTFSSLVSNVASFMVAFFLMMFFTFYLLKDGSKIKMVIMDLSPIANSQENILFAKISRAVNGVVKGQFLMALIQGAVAGIGFLFFGVPSPLIWALFTVIAALVPNVGTSISLVPAVIYLAITGHTGPAIGMAIWGALAVGLVDNFLGPKIIGKATQVHPVLVLLSVVGGLSLFGIIGFLLGPIIMATFVAMVDMYRTDFQKYLEG